VHLHFGAGARLLNTGLEGSQMQGVEQLLVLVLRGRPWVAWVACVAVKFEHSAAGQCRQCMLLVGWDASSGLLCIWHTIILPT
jgi:hypothetical protein